MRSSPASPHLDGVLLRSARADDDPDLIRLADLDSACPLAGPALVAEENGAIVAALCLSTRRVVADPFVPSEHLVELLRRYAARRQVRSAKVELLSPHQARDADLVEELVGLVNGAYAVGEAGLWHEGAKRTGPVEIAEAIRRRGMLAATLERCLVGCAYVRPLDAATADLSLVSTAPHRWGRGIGRELVRSAEELTRSRGVATMQLELLVPTGWVHPEKERLRAWYSRLGYLVARSAPVEEVAGHLASQLATPCEFEVFRKALKQR
jgi:GNAT superfamily N-acetyltransferase